MICAWSKKIKIKICSTDLLKIVPSKSFMESETTELVKEYK